MEFADKIICAASAVLYVVLFVVYLLKILNAKKNFSGEKKDVKMRLSYAASLIAAAVLVVLPVFVHLELYLVAVVCACSLMAEYMALKDRLEQFTGK